MLEHLDQLVQIRLDLAPIKSKKPLGTSKQLLNKKKPECDQAIESFGRSIVIFFKSLSNQSRDFIEKYIKENLELVHRFMNSKIPQSKKKSKTLSLKISKFENKREINLIRPYLL